MPRSFFDPNADFGNWTLVERGPRSGSAALRWLCRCQCGTERLVLQASLKARTSTGCGCQSIKRLIKMNVDRLRRHGESQQDTAEYRAWCHLNSRCHNPNNKRFAEYGGRGVTVAEKWMGEGGFERFLADVGRRPSPKHSIDRIDTDGPYGPGNCRWSTAEEQQNNKRNNRLVTIGLETLTLSEACRKYGVDYKLVHLRLRYGFTLLNAMTRPRKANAGHGRARPPISSTHTIAEIKAAFAAAASQQARMMKLKLERAA